MGAVERVKAAIFALLVDGGAHEVGDADTGYFDGILESEEDAFAGTHVHGHVKDVLALVDDLPFGDGVLAVAGNDPGEGAFAVAVGSHDGVHFAAVNFEVHALQYFFIADGSVQIADG